MVAKVAILDLQPRYTVSPLALSRWLFTIENPPFFESNYDICSEGNI